LKPVAFKLWVNRVQLASPHLEDTTAGGGAVWYHSERGGGGGRGRLLLLLTLLVANHTEGSRDCTPTPGRAAIACRVRAMRAACASAGEGLHARRTHDRSTNRTTTRRPVVLVLMDDVKKVSKKKEGGWCPLEKKACDVATRRL
jgi:hypothetical protein